MLRLVNTVNSKSGEVCRVIHVEQGGRRADPGTTSSIWPRRYCRWPLDIEADRKRPRRPSPVQAAAGRQTGNLHARLNGRQLAWDRLEGLAHAGP